MQVVFKTIRRRGMSELPPNKIDILNVDVYSKLPWFVSKFHLKISQMHESNVGGIRYMYNISCRGLCLNYLKKISQTWWSSVGIVFFNKLSRGLYLSYLKKMSQTWWSSVGSVGSTISYRGLCLNQLKKISQTWWSSVGSILQ